MPPIIRSVGGGGCGGIKLSCLFVCLFMSCLSETGQKQYAHDHSIGGGGGGIKIKTMYCHWRKQSIKTSLCRHAVSDQARVMMVILQIEALM